MVDALIVLRLGLPLVFAASPSIHAQRSFEPSSALFALCSVVTGSDRDGCYALDRQLAHLLLQTSHDGRVQTRVLLLASVAVRSTPFGLGQTRSLLSRLFRRSTCGTRGNLGSKPLHSVLANLSPLLLCGRGRCAPRHAVRKYKRDATLATRASKRQTRAPKTCVRFVCAQLGNAVLSEVDAGQFSQKTNKRKMAQGCLRSRTPPSRIASRNAVPHSLEHCQTSHSRRRTASLSPFQVFENCQYRAGSATSDVHGQGVRLPFVSTLFLLLCSCVCTCPDSLCSC